MELWQFLWVVGICHAFFYLVHYYRSQADLLSPTTLSALFLLIWFYPKVPNLAANPWVNGSSLEVFLLFWLCCQTTLLSSFNVSRFMPCLNSIRVPSFAGYLQWNTLATVLGLIGALAFYQYSRLPPEMLYMRQPTGFITILVFFSTFLSLALFTAVFSYQKTRRWMPLVIIVLGAVLYAERIFIHGKRTDLFTIMLLIGVFWIIFLNRRVRWPVILMCLFALLVLNSTVGQYRMVMKSDVRDTSNLANINVFDSISEGAISADHDLVNAVVLMSAHRMSGATFRLGADYWNAVVNRYVPGQLVGRSVKQSIIIELPDFIWMNMGYRRPIGTTTFLPGSLFSNFGWFGFLILYPYGLIMKNLFDGAKERSMAHLVLYVYFAGLLPVVLTFGLDKFVAPAMLWLPIFFLYARRVKGRSERLHEWNVRTSSRGGDRQSLDLSGAAARK